ncbi:hypothetical protein MNV49_004869 [Pseudohyphozyma bogoriensis]|nr:hypothetical protein MNV49_004869 [Pseudohyphozyma bogoriensis]
MLIKKRNAKSGGSRPRLIAAFKDLDDAVTALLTSSPSLNVPSPTNGFYPAFHSTSLTPLHSIERSCQSSATSDEVIKQLLIDKQRSGVLATGKGIFPLLFKGVQLVSTYGTGMIRDGGLEKTVVRMADVSDALVRLWDEAETFCWPQESHVPAYFSTAYHTMSAQAKRFHASAKAYAEARSAPKLIAAMATVGFTLSGYLDSHPLYKPNNNDFPLLRTHDPLSLNFRDRYEAHVVRPYGELMAVLRDDGVSKKEAVRDLIGKHQSGIISNGTGVFTAVYKAIRLILLFRDMMEENRHVSRLLNENLQVWTSAIEYCFPKPLRPPDYLSDFERAPERDLKELSSGLSKRKSRIYGFSA